MADSCSKFAQLAKEASIQQTEYTAQYAAAIAEKTKIIAEIDRRISEIPLVNRDRASYGTFTKIVDGIDGDARKRQLIAFCNATSHNGYPPGAFKWLGDQIPDGTGRVINWCLDNGYAGSCQTRGTCVISDEYIESLERARTAKIASLLKDRELVEKEREDLVLLKAPVVNIPACCQALEATGASLNVPVINQVCQVYSNAPLPSPTPPSTTPIPPSTTPTPPSTTPLPTTPPTSPTPWPPTPPSSGSSMMTIIIIILAIILAIGLVLIISNLGGDDDGEAIVDAQ